MTHRGEIPPAQQEQLKQAQQAVRESEATLRAAVADAHTAGGSIRVIAAKLGIAPNTVRQLLAAAELAAEPVDDAAESGYRWSDKLRSEELADRPVEELIDGFDEISALRIPYARLPRRASTCYSELFTTWSDLRGQTVASLLGIPLVWEPTLRELLAAAAAAVASARVPIEPVGPVTSIRRLLARLAPRDRTVLAARVWAPQPVAQPVVAKELGVSVQWVRRNEPRARARFEELLEEVPHQEVGAHAVALAARLGILAPADRVHYELLRVGFGDPAEPEVAVLLHLAGPYVPVDGWYENAKHHGRQRVDSAVEWVLQRDGVVSDTGLIGHLVGTGMTAEHATTYLSGHTGIRCFGDRWVRWRASVADKIEAVLHLIAEPATAETIAATSSADLSATYVKSVLSQDERFVRTSKRLWALKRWDLDEYGGISREIGTRIDAAGGHRTVEELVDELLATFPDLREESIRTNLSTIAFVNESGTVRRRTDADPWPAVLPLSTVRGVFRNGSSEIRVAIPVTTDVLRGSAYSIPTALSVALGVNPGQDAIFTTPFGENRVKWRLSATRGPIVGSLRPLAVACAATTDDTLLLVFDLDNNRLDASRIGPDVTGTERLSRFVGRQLRDPAAALAASLQCQRGEVDAVLRDRGDTDLAELIGTIPGLAPG